jgi:hypothetical protein
LLLLYGIMATAAQEDWAMKIVGWVVALAMIAGTGTAIALSVKQAHLGLRDSRHESS